MASVTPSDDGIVLRGHVSDFLHPLFFIQKHKFRNIAPFRHQVNTKNMTPILLEELNVSEKKNIYLRKLNTMDSDENFTSIDRSTEECTWPRYFNERQMIF